jgi:hypothetical protein
MIFPRDKYVAGNIDHTAQIKEKECRALSPYLIFSILLVPRLVAAQYSIIGDCDEGTSSQRRF